MKRLKTVLLFLLLGTFGTALVRENALCLAAARDALRLCAETVLPTLFPFFVLSSLSVACLGPVIGRAAGRFMRPLFSLGGAGGSALALGLLGGYPIGARTVGELYRRGEVSRAEAQQLLAFCGNCGLGFLLGFCGTGVLQSTRAGVYLFLVHTASALLTGLLLRRDTPCAAPGRSASAPPSLLAAFPEAVTSSLAAVLNVCAFVLLFQVLLRILLLFPPLAALPAAARACFAAFFELTSGVSALGATRGGFVVCAAAVGWGGLSVHAQTLSLLAPTGLSMRRYFLGKAVQTAVSIPLALLVSARLY